jgi:hypothetical protein
LGRWWTDDPAQSRPAVPASPSSVHEEGFAVIRGDDGALTFYRPDGTQVEAAPALARCGNDDADASWPTTKRLDAPPCWDSTPLDLGWVLDVLRRQSRH